MRRHLLLHTQCWVILCLSLMASAYSGCENPDSDTPTEPRHKTTPDDTLLPPPPTKEEVKQLLDILDKGEAVGKRAEELYASEDVTASQQVIKNNIIELQRVLREVLLNDQSPTQNVTLQPLRASSSPKQPVKLLQAALDHKYPLPIVQALVEKGAEIDEKVLKQVQFKSSDPSLIQYVVEKVLEQVLFHSSDPNLIQYVVEKGDIEKLEKSINNECDSQNWCKQGVIGKFWSKKNVQDQHVASITKALIRKGADPLYALDTLALNYVYTREDIKTSLASLMDCLLDDTNWTLSEELCKKHPNSVYYIGMVTNIEAESKQWKLIADKLLDRGFQAGQSIQWLLQSGSLEKKKKRNFIIHLLKNEKVDLKAVDKKSNECNEENLIGYVLKSASSDLDANKKLALIKALKARGANMIGRKGNFRSLLHHAVYHYTEGDKELFEWLLKHSPPEAINMTYGADDLSVLDALLMCGKDSAPSELLNTTHSGGVTEYSLSEDMVNARVDAAVHFIKKGIQTAENAQLEFSQEGFRKPKRSFVARAKECKRDLSSENWEKIRQAFIDIKVPEAELN